MRLVSTDAAARTYMYCQLVVHHVPVAFSYGTVVARSGSRGCGCPVSVPFVPSSSPGGDATRRHLAEWPRPSAAFGAGTCSAADRARRANSSSLLLERDLRNFFKKERPSKSFSFLVERPSKSAQRSCSFLNSLHGSLLKKKFTRIQTKRLIIASRVLV